jgi:hypothetical protein
MTVVENYTEGKEKPTEKEGYLRRWASLTLALHPALVPPLLQTLLSL